MKPAVSLIIVSKNRPADLERAIASLAFQSLVNFELIVVADRPPLVSNLLEQELRYFEMVEANISRARNIGIANAKAPIVAFCDDDAIPDPNWLELLIQPFYEDKNLGASGGYVRGRNGISFQWKGIGFFANGEDFSIKIDGDDPVIFPPHSEYSYKTIGTNCAFRKSALCKLGGFDEGFFYYLEDADMCKRLQDAGYNTAIVPKAQIIHNYRPSRGRSEERVPQSLYNLGASTHLFLRKHCPKEIDENLERLVEQQKQRLLEFFGRGLILPRHIKKLERDLRQGIRAGKTRESKTPLQMVRNFNPIKAETRTLAFNTLRRRPKPRSNSEIWVQTLITPTTLAAKIRFSREGFWRIHMGAFGRLERGSKLIVPRSPKAAHAAIQNWFRKRFFATSSSERKPF